MTIHFHNKRILITRAEPKASEFAEQITLHGGHAIVTPLIKIACTPNEEHAKLIKQLQEYEWLFFTSANGVNCFFKTLEANGGLERIKNVNIAAVGPKTNDALQAFGYEADFIPTVYNAKTMAPEFLEKYNPKRPVLIVRGQLSGTILNEALRNEAIPFDCMEVYRTVTNVDVKSKIQQVLAKEAIDFITFTSPSTVDAFMQLVDEPEAMLHNTIVCIGTTTEKRAIESGFQHILIPEAFTIEGMMKRMYEHIS